MFGQQSCSGFVSNQKKNLSCWMNKPRVPRHPPAPASLPGSLSAFLRFLWLQRQMQWEHMPGKWALEPVVRAHPQMRSELMLSCDYMRPSLETQRHFFMWQPNRQETPKSVERWWAPRLMVLCPLIASVLQICFLLSFPFCCIPLTLLTWVSSPPRNTKNRWGKHTALP